MLGVVWSSGVNVCIVCVCVCAVQSETGFHLATGGGGGGGGWKGGISPSHYIIGWILHTNLFDPKL